ncbi:MAG: carbonic anhydrase [Deltaproteobacteria bacterium]|jgi:carbonic anhydrase|nr:carbonic anhydrase [Deltaproteobacteria bacterium]
MKRIPLAMLSACLTFVPSTAFLAAVALAAFLAIGSSPASADDAAPPDSSGHGAGGAGHAAPAGHGGAYPWTADSALKALQDGNARFVAGQPSPKDPQAGKALRDKLAAEGQFPLAAVLSCSDSRAPVEELFDMSFGDIFSIRAAGAVPGVDQLGSIEYAVAHIGVPLVVVLAHTKCGAVSASVAGSHEPGNLGELLAKLSPISEAVKDVSDSDKVRAAVYLSAKRFTEALPGLSPVIKQALDQGTVRLVDAVYDIDTGQVHFHP